MPINCDSNKLFSKIDSRQLIIISWPNINESSRSSREWRNSRLVRSNRKQVGGSARTLLYIQLGGTGQRFVLEQPLFRSFSRFLVVSYTHKLYCACSLKECYPGLWSEARLICCNMCIVLSGCYPMYHGDEWERFCHPKAFKVDYIILDMGCLHPRKTFNYKLHYEKVYWRIPYCVCGWVCVWRRGTRTRDAQCN